MIKDHKKLQERVSKHIQNWNSGHLKGEMGYKFYTKKFLGVVFLYSNSVDAKNPDITGRGNRNTFINDAHDVIQKIKEQVRLDLIDIDFRVSNDTGLGSFVVKAANAKLLRENRFDKEIDQVVDDAVDYGSGIVKIWKDSKGKLKLRSVDPYKIAWQQDNFAQGAKVEVSHKTYRQIIDNPAYDATAIARLVSEIGPDENDKWDETVLIQQYVKDLSDGQQEIILTCLDHDLTLMREVAAKQVYYLKYDYKKRRGFPDALGVGCYELVFNRLVQSKVNRDRLDKLMDLASKGMMMKKLDGERDAIAGQEVLKAKTGMIVGYKENPIEPLNLGLEENISHVKNEVEAMAASVGGDLNVGEALEGKTLPSGTSGVLGNLLTQNSSSVLKEVQIAYGNFIAHMYDEAGIKEYLLSAFDSEEAIEKHLTPNDLALVKQHYVGFLVARKQVEAALDGQEFNEANAEAEAKNELKGRSFKAGDLLNQLREDVTGIEVDITAETFNKAAIVAQYRELRFQYAANPALFYDPFYIASLRAEYEADSGLHPVALDKLLEELPSQEQQAPALDPLVASRQTNAVV